MKPSSLFSNMFKAKQSRAIEKVRSGKFKSGAVLTANDLNVLIYAIRYLEREVARLKGARK